MNTLDRFQTYIANRHFASLDGLRALSILIVVWHHVAFAALPDDPIFPKGPLGAEIFFTVSGFLITTLLLREKARYGSISVGRFFARRILRIWPLYFTALLGYVFLIYFFEKDAEHRAMFFRSLPFFATFSSNWSPYTTHTFYFSWSLAMQEQFLLLWIPLLQFTRRWFGVGVLCLMVLMDVLAIFHLPSPTRYYPPFIAESATGIATPMCLGSLMAILLNSRRGFEFAYSFLGARWSSGIVIGLLLTLRVNTESIGSWWPIVQWAILPLLVGSCIVREDHFLAPVLRWKPLQQLGMVSYGMYLFHSLAIRAGREALSRFGVDWLPMEFLVGTILSFTAARISYAYYESFFLRMKDRFRRKKSEALVPSPEPSSDQKR